MHKKKTYQNLMESLWVKRTKKVKVMKANEAPEKIYLTTFGFPLCEPIPQESSNPDTVWSKKQYTGADSIEYTRTDAFIEKACEWLSKHVKKYYFNKEGHYLGTDELVEDFKLSMELWHTT